MARCNLNNDFVAPVIDVDYDTVEYEESESDTAGEDSGDEFSLQL